MILVELVSYWPYVIVAITPLAGYLFINSLIRRRRATRLQNRVLEQRTPDDSTNSYVVYRVDEKGTILSIWRLNDASIALGVEEQEKAKDVHGRLYYNNKLVREW